LLRRWDNNDGNNNSNDNCRRQYNNKVSTIIFKFPNISFHFGSVLSYLMFFGVFGWCFVAVPFE